MKDVALENAISAGGDPEAGPTVSASLFELPVFILGPMRSGTSLIASILQECGLWLGTSIPPSPANPKGFFENRYFKQRVTKRLLSSIGADPSGIDPLPPPGARARLPGLKSKTRGWLEREGWHDDVPWGAKDPKLSLIWETLAEAFPGARWVVVRRRLDEIARSCVQSSFLQNRRKSEDYWRSLAAAYVDRIAPLVALQRNVFEADSGDVVEGQWAAIQTCVEGLDLRWNAERIAPLVDRHLWNTPLQERRERIQWYLAARPTGAAVGVNGSASASGPEVEPKRTDALAPEDLLLPTSGLEANSLLPQKLVEPPRLFTPSGHVAPLCDLFQGRSAFLICGGPSLTSHELRLLQGRGIVTMSVNNAATVFRSQLWVSVDTAGNFADGIWKDPGIMKFVPKGNLDHRIVVRSEDGQLLESEEIVRSMPNVFCFERNSDFLAEQWLRESTFNYGNRDDVADVNGDKGARSVMYVAIKLLYILGARTVFLLGCDFRMAQGAKNYAFEQDRDPSSVQGNNRSYEVFARRIQLVLPHLRSAGVRVFNCTPGSALTVFPYVRFEDAVRFAQKEMPRDIVTRGMYDRGWHRHRVKANSLERFVHDELTLVVAVPRDLWRPFLLARRTWLAAFPMLRNSRTLIIYDQRVHMDDAGSHWMALSPKVSWQPIGLPEDLDPIAALCRASLAKIAGEVTTEWFLSLSPMLVAFKKGSPLPDSLADELRGKKEIGYAGPSVDRVSTHVAREVSDYLGMGVDIGNEAVNAADTPAMSRSRTPFYCYLGRTDVCRSLPIRDGAALSATAWNALYPLYVRTCKHESRAVSMTSQGWEPIATPEFLELRAEELLACELREKDA